VAKIKMVNKDNTNNVVHIISELISIKKIFKNIKLLQIQEI